MFGDVNSVTLIGNITNDLLVRYTGNGTAVISFGLATNRRYKLPDSEEWKEEPTFHNIVLFGKQAEFLTQRGRKGTRVYVTGRLQTRNWQDKEGKTNYKTEIVVDRMLLLDRYERNNPGSPSGDYSKSAPAQSASPAEEADIYDTKSDSSGKKTGGKDNIIDTDDLPF
jgi:single-strand DNA-binding protein